MITRTNIVRQVEEDVRDFLDGLEAVRRLSKAHKSINEEETYVNAGFKPLRILRYSSPTNDHLAHFHVKGIQPTFCGKQTFSKLNGLKL